MKKFIFEKKTIFEKKKLSLKKNLLWKNYNKNLPKILYMRLITINTYYLS